MPSILMLHGNRLSADMPTCCSKSEHNGIEARRAFAAVRLQHLSQGKPVLLCR